MDATRRLTECLLPLGLKRIEDNALPQPIRSKAAVDGKQQSVIHDDENPEEQVLYVEVLSTHFAERDVFEGMNHGNAAPVIEKGNLR